MFFIVPLMLAVFTTWMSMKTDSLVFLLPALFFMLLALVIGWLEFSEDPRESKARREANWEEFKTNCRRALGLKEGSH